MSMHFYCFLLERSALFKHISEKMYRYYNVYAPKLYTFNK